MAAAASAPPLRERLAAAARIVAGRARQALSLQPYAAPERKELFTFTSDADVRRFTCISDASVGGHSHAETQLVTLDDGGGERAGSFMRFRGAISLHKPPELARSGFAAVRWRCARERHAPACCAICTITRPAFPPIQPSWGHATVARPPMHFCPAARAGSDDHADRNEADVGGVVDIGADGVDDAVVAADGDNVGRGVGKFATMI